jgi:hypothetical protein
MENKDDPDPGGMDDDVWLRFGRLFFRFIHWAAIVRASRSVGLLECIFDLQHPQNRQKET